MLEEEERKKVEEVKEFNKNVLKRSREEEEEEEEESLLLLSVAPRSCSSCCVWVFLVECTFQYFLGSTVDTVHTSVFAARGVQDCFSWEMTSRNCLVFDTVSSTVDTR